MSRCTDTLRRRNKVNPADDHTINPSQGRWEEKPDIYSTAPDQETSSTPACVPEDAPEQTGTSRKSSKAKRVKSYLKKCKNAALGNTDGTNDSTTAPTPSTSQEAPRSRRHKRRSNSGNRDVSSTSWYVAETSSATAVLPIELKQGVEVFDEGQVEEHVEILDLEEDFVGSSQSEAVETLRPGLDGPGDVLDSRTEGGTTILVVSRSPEPVIDDPEGDSEPATNLETCNSTAVSEVKGDVASLVEQLMGPLFPNFHRTRGILVRQARDLLVCTFHGNLVRFEREFLEPAAALLQRLRNDLSQQGGDVVAPHGWPLSVGPGGVALQLGELDPSLLRTRDCYLCVRLTGQEVELAVVWRGESTMGSHVVVEPRCLESVLGMELALAEAEGLPGLLQSLLVSVERALERVPLDDLAFPCPQCREPCACACLPLVQKRDTSIQTSPMFEFAGPIPHIDSDDDIDQDDTGGKGTQTPSVKNSRETVVTAKPPEEIIPPKNIADLPEKLLMSGIHLPGTHDIDGRPVLCVESSSVAKAGLDRHQVALLLLYYASLPRPERMEKGLSLLLLSGNSEMAVLDLLDKALHLVRPHVKIGNMIVWRNGTGGDGGRYHSRNITSNSSNVLETAGVQYHVVRDAAILRNYIDEDQAPICCGGRANHDQLEWVEFHKEVEPLLALCYQCGRRLVSIMCELRTSEGHPPPSRRQLHQQHRTLARVLAEPELQRLRREGSATLNRLQERAQWLPASEDVRLSTERAMKLFAEVDRAAQRLEQLAEGRRERLRDIARLRALEDESSQVLSWLCKKGEETLRRHAQLATNLSAIKEQEQDFEKFYFISMRHLDKGSDLLEEASQCSGEDSGHGRSSSGGGLRDLARSLKQHLLGFSERLEDTRERLEDTSRCFYLLDKAYEWALETMKYMSRVKADDAQTPDQTLQLLKHLQQYLMAHPPVPEDHFSEMLQLAKKLGNDKLLEQAKVAHSRCQETMELIREQQSRLVRTRQQLGIEEDSFTTANTEDPERTRPMSPKAQHFGWSSSAVATSTPVGGIGRRRSVGSFPYIYKCSHHAAGHSCSCWDPTPPPSILDESGECCCARRPNNLGNIQEVRESAEDLLEDSDEAVKSDESVCGQCSSVSTHQRLPLKRHLRRSCTWQYPTENFDEEDNVCDNSRLCGSRDDHKCEYSTDNMGDNTTEGSDGCIKSGEDLEEQDGSSGGSNKSVPPVPVNSHLHCHASSLDLQSSLAAVSTKELKTHKTLLLIMREMIQTERDYVKSLEYVIENYIPELLREDIPQALRGQRNVIFGNVEKIFEFHNQYFLQELEKCENSPLTVGQCFLRHEKKFYLYALYNKNKPKSDSLMSEYGTLFFKTKQLELGDKMDLASYLLKPVQRMGKYALLLQQLMKAYPDKEADVADIKAAEQMVRFQLRHGNDLLAMDSLRDCDVNVKEQGRLLRQNEFLVWQGKGKKCLRHVFLFEDLILFSKARRFPDRKNLDLYIYKNSIKMTDIGLTAKIGDSPTKFEIWFRKRKPNDTFTLQSMSEEIKQAWTEEISKLLWKQALRNREMRLAEMSSMGIGNKPCLDIRPSADQISDRSISIAQLSKTAPRFRNSITASSGELSRSNKRPHSIISVSSSSSSGGSSTSHSSASTYGALVNLAFDPVDSPHMHHRSTTLHSQCSTESGIIADISLGSEDTDGSGNHWHVERSNSSVTSMSLDSSMSPTSPMSPTEEDKACLMTAGNKDNTTGTNESETDQEELSIKL